MKADKVTVANTPAFKDHFSKVAAAYSRFRPSYPEALFAFLADRAPGRALAWDCATGSGQVARGLVPWFDVVVATDASAAQVDDAIAHPRVAYRVAPAERCPLRDGSVQLVTVAQALHWFDQPAFFSEVRRVLPAGGLLAVWSYGVMRVESEIDELIDHLYGEVLGPYWPPERRLVEAGLAGVVLPFPEVPVPDFSMQAEWGRDAFMGYLSTWSAVSRYRAAESRDPLEAFARVLARIWPEAEERRQISWPLHIRLAAAD